MTVQPPVPSATASDPINGLLRRKEALFDKVAATAYQAVLAISQNDESRACCAPPSL